MARSRGGMESRVLAWLREPGQPSVQYRTLTELLGRRKTDAEVRAARRRIRTTGWAAEILARRSPGAGWGDGSSTYRPKYTSTNWMMLTLSELGVTRDDPAVRDACEYWMADLATKDGGLGGNSKGTPHYCVAANQARAAIRFGYADDSRVGRTMEWLTETADPKGGWSCMGVGRNLDSWEALSAFAVYPRARWSGSMRSAVEKGAEFYLSRRLHQQGSEYPPWYRTHFPVHYYYDLLVGLDFLSALGYGADPRMDHALEWLRSRRRPDGAWNLDAVHPDVLGGVAAYYARNPSHRPTPFSLEKVGRPSKMITLTALRVLANVDTARRTGRSAP